MQGQSPEFSMSERTPRLADDTYVMMGIRERVRPDITRHQVHTFTREQMDLDNLCGMRADWIIVFGDYEQEWMNTVIKPFLVAASIEEIQAAQRGVPIPTYPVLWHVPAHTKILK